MCIQHALCIFQGVWVHNGVLNVYDRPCIMVVLFTKILLLYSHGKIFSNSSKIITTISINCFQITIIILFIH
jgi:hypothetical protein